VTDVHGTSARRRMLVAAAAGLVGLAVELWIGPWDMAPLAWWDTAAAVLLGWVWLTVGRLDGDGTARLACLEDPTAAASDLLVLSAAVASLFAVGLAISGASSEAGAAAFGRMGFGVVSVLLSWALVHTVYTLRYADMYYGGAPGGIEFNQPERPRYADFAYLAFTVGVAFQVSDTPLRTAPIRSTVLRHSLLSYLFSTVIIAITINMVANLIK
jgi:uncharacterized membrane protein